MCYPLSRACNVEKTRKDGGGKKKRGERKMVKKNLGEKSREKEKKNGGTH